MSYSASAAWVMTISFRPPGDTNAVLVGFNIVTYLSSFISQSFACLNLFLFFCQVTLFKVGHEEKCNQTTAEQESVVLYCFLVSCCTRDSVG